MGKTTKTPANCGSWGKHQITQGLRFRYKRCFNRGYVEILRDSNPLHLFEEMEVVAAYGEQLRSFFEL